MATQITLTTREIDQYAQLAQEEFRKVDFKSGAEIPQVIQAIMKIIDGQSLEGIAKPIAERVSPFSDFMVSFKKGEYTKLGQLEPASKIFKETIINISWPFQKKLSEGEGEYQSRLNQYIHNREKEKAAAIVEFRKRKRMTPQINDSSANDWPAIEQSLLELGLEQKYPRRMQLLCDEEKSVSSLVKAGVYIECLACTEYKDLEKILGQCNKAVKLVEFGLEWGEIVTLVQHQILLDRFLKLIQGARAEYETWSDRGVHPSDRGEWWGILREAMRTYPLGLLSLWENGVDFLDLLAIPPISRNLVLVDGETIGEVVDVLPFSDVQQHIREEWFQEFLAEKMEERRLILVTIRETLNAFESEEDMFDIDSFKELILARKAAKLSSDSDDETFEEATSGTI